MVYCIMTGEIANPNTSIRVKIHRSISEIDERAWDAIVDKDRIFCAHRYVKALEESGINEGRCYYLAAYNGDEIIAHTCAYYLSSELDLFARGGLRKTINLIRRKWKNFFILRSLECGPPIALGNSLSFKDGVNRPEALRLICHEIETLAKELGINFILFRDFYDNETDLQGHLKERGYMKMHNLPKAEIRVRWKSFDEYLDSMRSNYRCKIVKSMDKCAKANISIEVFKNFSANAGELKRLYDNVYDQAKEVKRERIPESFFHNFDRHLADKAVMLTAKKDDKLVGYMLSVFSGKTIITMFPGLDYSCSKEYCVYFNIFYKTIELAINSGIENIDMGVTTLDPKKDMGSSVVALNMYARHSNAMLNKIIPFVFDMIAPPDTTGPRNVFKDSVSANA